MNDWSSGNMPTLNNDNNSFRQPPPPPRYPNPLWIISAMTIGFILPVCACIVLTFGSLFSLGAVAQAFDPAADTGSGRGVGVIDLTGPIFQGDGIGASTTAVIRDIEWMEDNSDVRAILIRANSPGGGANATDLIWDRLARVQKPVVVWVNGTCASGCYYIAMAADPNEIYASPNSLIGSIGVISTFFNIEELADEIGVDVDVVATGENKDFGSLFRPLTEEERAYWLEQTNIILENFITAVDGGRPNLNEGEVRELANGRVWVANNAQELGLIDGIMYEQDALDHAANLAGLGSSYRVIESPFEPTIFDLFLDSPSGFGTELQLPSAEDILNSLQQSPVQYRYLGPHDDGAATD